MQCNYDEMIDDNEIHGGESDGLTDRRNVQLYAKTVNSMSSGHVLILKDLIILQF